MPDRALTVTGLCRAYGDVQALLDFNVEIHQHEFVAVVGPSGCGKTTLLNLLAGYEEPTSGRIIRSAQPRMIHQREGLFPWLTVAENILLGLRDIPDPTAKQRQLRELLALIRLERFGEHYPYQLSGGMRQLVELARALAGDSDILLMDEPFSSLDYLTRLRMRQELARVFHERPRTVVLVTHDIEEAAQLADRLFVLSERPGRIRGVWKLDAPRPRDPTHPAVVQAVHQVLTKMGVEREATNVKEAIHPAIT